MQLTVEGVSTTVKRSKPIRVRSAGLTACSPASRPAAALHPDDPGIRIADLGLSRQPLRRLPSKIQEMDVARIRHVPRELLAERVLFHLHLQASQTQEQLLDLAPIRLPMLHPLV